MRWKSTRVGAERHRWLLGVACLVLSGCHAAGRDPGYPSPAARSGPVVTLAAVGDILLDRGVGAQVVRRGTAYPFEKVANLLRSADLAFGNLECPLSAKGTKVIK